MKRLALTEIKVEKENKVNKVLNDSLKPVLNGFFDFDYLDRNQIEQIRVPQDINLTMFEFVCKYRTGEYILHLIDDDIFIAYIDGVIYFNDNEESITPILMNRISSIYYKLEPSDFEEDNIIEIDEFKKQVLEIEKVNINIYRKDGYDSSIFINKYPYTEPMDGKNTVYDLISKRINPLLLKSIGWESLIFTIII